MSPFRWLVPLSVLGESWAYCTINLVSPAQTPENASVPWGGFSHSAEQLAWGSRSPLGLVNGDEAVTVGGGWAWASLEKGRE